MDQVSFEATDREVASVNACVKRGQDLKIIPRGGRLHHAMNLLAVNANGNPIDFDRLLGFDDFNFTHDVLGIDRHLDRDTGQLNNMFRPRSSRHDH